MVLFLNAQNPTAVLFDAVLHSRALLPTAVLDEPTKFCVSASLPIATLLTPVVFLDIFFQLNYLTSVLNLEHYKMF